MADNANGAGDFYHSHYQPPGRKLARCEVTWQRRLESDHCVVLSCCTYSFLPEAHRKILANASTPMHYEHAFSTWRDNLYTWLLLALALGFFVAACSSQQSGTDASGIGTTGTTIGQAMTGPEPGTQAYLNQTIGDRVFFDFDRHAIRSDMQGTVTAWAQWLKENPEVNILVEGHADERGTRNYNYALGVRTPSFPYEHVKLTLHPVRFFTHFT